MIKYLSFKDHIDIPQVANEEDQDLVDLQNSAVALDAALTDHAKFLDPARPDPDFLALFPDFISQPDMPSTIKLPAFLDITTPMGLAIAKSMPHLTRLQMFSSTSQNLPLKVAVDLESIDASLRGKKQAQLITSPTSVTPYDFQIPLTDPGVWTFNQSNVDMMLNFLNNPPQRITPNASIFATVMRKLNDWQNNAQDIMVEYLENLSRQVKKEPDLEIMYELQKEFGRLNFEINTNLKEIARTAYLDGRFPEDDWVVKTPKLDISAYT